MLVLALVVRVLPVYITKQQLDTYAVELGGKGAGRGAGATRARRAAAGRPGRPRRPPAPRAPPGRHPTPTTRSP